jgi:hypothetical protein
MTIPHSEEKDQLPEKEIDRSSKGRLRQRRPEMRRQFCG